MSDKDFLPPDYEAPSGSGNYMKLLQGENRIRILGKPILGWEGWKDKQPHRFRLEDRPIPTGFDNEMVKHFWAFVCWDYADESIKVCEITQVSIQKAIESLARDKDWGPPFGYDIKITRRGEKLETEYTVNPVPHSEITQEIKDALVARPVRLEALFDGDDPFDADNEPSSDPPRDNTPPMPKEEDIP